MTSSLTVTFTGNTSVLQANFLPEITLDAYGVYSCALLDLIIKSIDESIQSLKLKVLRVDCDIISDSYINGERGQTIHQFAASASLVKGRTIVEIPKNLNYFPVKTQNLRSIQISIVDDKGASIDLNGAEIICRISIKRDNSEKIIEDANLPHSLQRLFNQR